MDLNKLYSSVLKEVNQGTVVARNGRYSKGPYDTKLSPALQKYDDDLAHKDMLPLDDNFFQQWDKDTVDAAWKDAHQKAIETDDTISKIAKEYISMFPGTQVTSRLKTGFSAKRKASSVDVGWAGMDDLVGYAIIFDNQEDVIKAAKRMYDDDKCLRIYDYEDDDPCNYYGYNCSMRGKVGNEI